MTDDPSAAPTDPLARFAWHPEPELIGYGDAATSRAAMERLGADTWATALDFLYDQAAHRAMGDPSPYAALRASFFGATGGPSPAPATPSPIADVLAEFRDRLAGGQMNAQHPRQFGYFTPPPLPVSMMGELLAQMTNQGVDVWHAGSARDLRRGGGRALAVRPRRLRAGRRSACSRRAASWPTSWA